MLPTGAAVQAVSNQTAGVLFLVVLLTFAVIWFSVTRRRQSWWAEYSRRPRDITGERWMNASEARADKPMPERYSARRGSRTKYR